MTEKEKQTEEKIFEAATEVFEEKGMDGARMQDIADRAGINKALLHYYFRTKDLLFDAVFQKLAGILFSKFAPVLSKEMTLEEKLRLFYREHITFMQENPRLPAFVIHEINRKPARIKRLLKNVDFNTLFETLSEQNKEEFEAFHINKEYIPQVMTSIVALSVFPFLARAILEIIFEKIGTDFDTYLEQRKDFAPEFILGALTSRKIK
jgi:AcrR family transcriptional regulator